MGDYRKWTETRKITPVVKHAIGHSSRMLAWCRKRKHKHSRKSGSDRHSQLFEIPFRFFFFLGLFFHNRTCQDRVIGVGMFHWYGGGKGLRFNSRYEHHQTVSSTLMLRNISETTNYERRQIYCLLNKGWVKNAYITDKTLIYYIALLRASYV